MYPPVFQTVDVPAVQTLLKSGTGPLRVFPFGQAPQGVEKPYAVWSMRNGAPENYLNRLPDIDNLPVRFDVYATPAQGTAVVLQVAKALRDAIEPHAHVVSWLGDSQDPDTKNFRFTFVAEWWLDRD